MEEIKTKILEEYKNGNIVVSVVGGLLVMPIKEFIKQPTNEMLYDLNRNEAVVLTFLSDPKWINDYAVAKVTVGADIPPYVYPELRGFKQ